MPVSKFDIFIVAGESSGDLHSAHLVSEINKIQPGTSIEAVGGIKLKQTGVKLLFDYSEINFVGFVKVFSNLKFLRKKLNEVIRHIYEHNPKIIVLCDFPGFNLRLAKSIRKKFKGKIIYYITPQVWAWNPGRIKTIRECIDMCLVVFPFEKELFERNHINSHYIGHPLANQVKNFRNSYTPVRNKEFTISLMPGSRPEEIIRILPRMNRLSKKLTGEYGFNVRLICSDVADPEIYRKYYNDLKGEFITSEKDSNLKAIADSDFVITKFGTSNLECALLGIPFCAVYRAGFINYIIARMLLKIKYVSLVNIIFNREIVKEFIQYNFTEENIICEILRVKDNDEYRKWLLSNFSNLWDYFGVNRRDASKLILNELKQI